ncbi:MAG: PAS domain S-box protein [Actinobacteria bacterium]|nr:PAS domain S-box protein [Actinomycetota bacterium]
MYEASEAGVQDRDYVKLLSTLIEACTSLHSSLHLSDVLARASQAAFRISGMDRAVIGLYHPEKETVETVSGFGEAHPLTSYRVSDLGDEFVALTQGKTIFIKHLVDAGLSLKARELASALSIKSALAVPMMENGLLLGVIFLYSTGRPHPIPSSVVEAMNALADQAAVSIKNAKQYEAQERKALEKQAEQREDILENLIEQFEGERGSLQAVLEQMPAGVIIAEAPAGRLIFGNKQIEEIWRHPFHKAAEIGQYKQYKGFHPEDGRPYRPEEWPLARSITSGEIVKDEEIDFLRGDGTRGTQAVSSTPIRDRGGRIVAGVAVFTDITERKRAEEDRKQLLEQLREEQSTLKAIIDNAPEGIVVADIQGRVMLTNQVADRLYARPIPYGESFESHAGLRLCHTDGKLYDPRDLPLTRSALDGETFTNVEMAIIWPDGERRELLVNTAPIRDNRDNIIGAVGVFQDITERKQIEKERERLLVQIKQLSDMINNR